MRSVLLAIIHKTIGERLPLTGNSESAPKCLLDFFRFAERQLLLAVQTQSNPSFAKAREIAMARNKRIKFLVLSATDVEDRALHSSLKNCGYRKDDPGRFAGESYVETFCLGRTVEVFHARSGPGSVGSSGSELVSSDVARVVDPDYVILFGICFGLKEGKLNIGDVLVSETVHDYEKIREESDGRHRDRSDRIPASPRLLSTARSLARSYFDQSVKVHCGLFLSGLKLIDSLEKVVELRNRYPDALGGDMEASGVMATCSRYTKKWIVVKAICDWAYEKEGSQQESAANNAAAFVVRLVKLVAEAESKA